MAGLCKKGLTKKNMRCFDIGGSSIVAADVSPSGVATVRSRRPTPHDNFSDFCEVLLAESPDNSDPVSISIAGVTNPQTGVINSANIPCISGKKLASALNLKLERKVYLINDAKAFALAEACMGQARHADVVLATILGTGVGGAIVINGQLFEGTDGTAGEWGHGPAAAARTGFAIPVLKCNCGQTGCVDTLGGARGLEFLHQHITSVKADSHSIVNAWQQKDSAATEVIDVWLDIVGGALANAVNVIAPASVPVGGGLANCDALIHALDCEVSQRRLVQPQSQSPSSASPLLYSAAATTTGVKDNGEPGLVGAAIYARSMSGGG